MHQSGSLAVAAVLTELWRCFFLIFGEIYSSCASSLKEVVHKCMYCLTAITGIRCDCEASKGRFSPVRGGFIKVWWRDMIILLSWMSDGSSTHSICKFADNVFLLTKIELQVYQNIDLFFFFQSQNIFSNSFNKIESMVHVFFCSQDCV